MLSLEWTAGMTPEQKENFERVLLNNSLLTDRINLILDQWENEIDRSELTIKDFDTPNWKYKQVFRNGDRSRIRKLKDLFSFRKKT